MPSPLYAGPEARVALPPPLAPSLLRGTEGRRKKEETLGNTEDHKGEEGRVQAEKGDFLGPSEGTQYELE